MTNKRAAFTLRLDEGRHLRLRLVSAVRNKSAQQIALQALDELFATVPGLNDLAAKARGES